MEQFTLCVRIMNRLCEYYDEIPRWLRKIAKPWKLLIVVVVFILYLIQPGTDLKLFEYKFQRPTNGDGIPITEKHESYLTPVLEKMEYLWNENSSLTLLAERKELMDLNILTTAEINQLDLKTVQNILSSFAKTPNLHYWISKIAFVTFLLLNVIQFEVYLFIALFEIILVFMPPGHYQTTAGRHDDGGNTWSGLKRMHLIGLLILRESIIYFVPFFNIWYKLADNETVVGRENMSPGAKIVAKGFKGLRQLSARLRLTSLRTTSTRSTDSETKSDDDDSNNINNINNNSSNNNKNNNNGDETSGETKSGRRDSTDSTSSTSRIDTANSSIWKKVKKGVKKGVKRVKKQGKKAGPILISFRERFLELRFPLTFGFAMLFYTLFIVTTMKLPSGFLGIWGMGTSWEKALEKECDNEFTPELAKWMWYLYLAFTIFQLVEIFIIRISRPDPISNTKEEVLRRVTGWHFGYWWLVLYYAPYDDAALPMLLECGQITIKQFFRSQDSEDTIWSSLLWFVEVTHCLVTLCYGCEYPKVLWIRIPWLVIEIWNSSAFLQKWWMNTHYISKNAVENKVTVYIPVNADYDGDDRVDKNEDLPGNKKEILQCDEYDELKLDSDVFVLREKIFPTKRCLISANEPERKFIPCTISALDANDTYVVKCKYNDEILEKMVQRHNVHILKHVGHWRKLKKKVKVKYNTEKSDVAVEGAFRQIFRMKDEKGQIFGDHFAENGVTTEMIVTNLVYKRIRDAEFKNVGGNICYWKDVYQQYEVHVMAKAFNDAVRNTPDSFYKDRIMIAPTALMVLPEVDYKKNGTMFAIEPLIPGGDSNKFQKWSGNVKFIEHMYRVDSTPHTFSHFTWHHTKGRKMVADIQGISTSKFRRKYLLTDPIITTSKNGQCSSCYENNDKFDGGINSLANFHKAHYCGKDCEILGLDENPFKKNSNCETCKRKFAVDKNANQIREMSDFMESEYRKNFNFKGTFFHSGGI